jgi:LysM repeat protein
MRHKCLIFNSLLLIGSYANGQINVSPLTGNYLLTEFGSANQLYFSYKVTKNQTLYNISKSFNIPVDSLLAANHLTKENGLQENTSIKVPFESSKLLAEKPENNDSCIKLFYQVQPKESLYHLSKRKFEIDLKTLIQLNNLSSRKIREGILLFIGFYPISNFVHPEKSIEPKISSPIIEEEKADEVEKFTKEARGVAICETINLGSGRLFALHNTALMDSQIEIINPILNRKVHAKVIGRIPPIYEHDVQVVVSGETAKKLGSLDKRFFVRLRYR